MRCGGLFKITSYKSVAYNLVLFDDFILHFMGSVQSRLEASNVSATFCHASFGNGAQRFEPISVRARKFRCETQLEHV